ncbi:MAG: hypothetical protein FVQ79_05910 [Planctomycetes bacterium]|nr:hypothetical protein [Planctomycetota bacterium]
MLQYKKVRDIVLGHARQLGSETVDLTRATNRILVQDVFANIDVPSFDKSSINGFACRRADLDNELTVIETVHVGNFPERTISKNECARITGGAMVPLGADCVVRVEHMKIISRNGVRFIGRETKDNIRFRGEKVKKGDVVLAKGTRIKPQHIAILAAMDCTCPCVASNANEEQYNWQRISCTK